MKSIFRKITLLAFVLVSFFGINAYANYGVIQGNNSLAKAHHFGHWHGKSGIVEIPSGKKEAYFSFTISQGEKIMITASADQYNVKIELLDHTSPSLDIISSSEGAVQPSYTRFAYVTCNGDYTNQTFYFRIVLPENFNSKILIPVGFQDRIKPGSQTFTFNGVAKNTGNSMLYYNGTDSDELSMNLSNANIPKEAKVTLVSTTSNMYPYQGNVKHFVSVNDTWYPSKVNNANSGMYYISLDDNVSVANLWKFKYNAKATSSSKMSNIKLNISYIYDITQGDDYHTKPY